ncbi:MAG: sialate O-acetylesterase [Chitinophagaceae bacterium]
MKRVILLLLLFYAGIVTLQAQLRLPRLISSGMILQRNTPLHIWGWASAGDTVSLTGDIVKSRTYTTVADRNGNWKIQLPALKSGGPFSMQVKADRAININDILVGDVWLCSGQSNMELPMERVKYRYPEEMKGPGHEQIRQFLVPDRYDFTSPQPDVADGDWKTASAQNIGQFSAVGYFFARELYTRYKIPVGLINSALGGSPADCWMSEEALKSFPASYNEMLRFRDDSLIRSVESKDNRLQTLWSQFLNTWDRGIAENWKSADLDDTAWPEILLPGYWADIEGKVSNGAYWFRKTIDVPASLTQGSIRLELGRIVDADSVFINGQYVGWTSYQYPPRHYTIPSGLLKPGRNTIAIKVVNQSGRGGFVHDKLYALIGSSDTLSLRGLWKYQCGISMPPLPGQTFVRWKPGGLYNAMIAPLTNYAIKGVCWYQGEADTWRPQQYTSLLQSLIADWRHQWQQPDLPFLYVQLCNFMEALSGPSESNWAALRQAQLNLLSTPHTAMAVTIDLGEWNDIHPENKKDVGIRLALAARNQVYGEKKLTWSGPIFRRMERKGNKLILQFDHIGSGLVSRDGQPLKHFTIAGNDNTYFYAQARIIGDQVEIWSPELDEPVRVRYAWANNPARVNFYNKEGLPASPFEGALP